MIILCDYCGMKFNASSISGGDPFDVICPDCIEFDADEENVGVEDDGSIGLEGTTIDSKLPKPQNS